MVATKEQERKALEKIATIISELGAGSYLDTTFKGILEQAEENITNDFGSNYKEMYEAATERAEKEREAAIKAANEYTELLNKYTDQAEELEDLKALRKLDNEVSRKYLDDLNKALSERAAKAAEVESLKSKIVELKAKLYDLITK